MKIVLHGILAERFGAEHFIETDVPADAIEGLSRQLPEWPRDLLIDVIDHPTEQLLRSRTDVDEIHLMPRMYGGGGKWGQILLGAALIGISFIPGLGQIAGVAISSMLFSAGASMVLMGVSQLFMKAPTVDKSNDPPPSKYLGINKNTTAIGTLMALAWGRIKISGQWLSLQSDSNQLVTTSFPATTS